MTMIVAGTCLDGPLKGYVYRQTTRPPVESGVFNYVGLHGERGSYTLRLNGWKYGEWIEEASCPCKTT